MSPAFEIPAREVIDFLRAMDPADNTDSPGQRTYGRVSQEQGEAIAAFIRDRGGRDLFIELDERPGRFDEGYASGDWHYKLRQARNTCVRFFEVLG